MALTYAVDQLISAARILAADTRPLDQRLQQAWSERVAKLWTEVHLPEHLNERFKQMWARYAAPSDDSRSTMLRNLSEQEQLAATQEVIDLAFATVVADTNGEQPATSPIVQ